MITSDRLVICLIFVVIGVLACFAPAQGDTWWHLRAGQDIWRTHQVPLTDTYSYTAAGRTFLDHGWLSEVLFSGLQHVGGMPLLAAGTAVMIFTAWLLSWSLADGPFEVGLVALLGGVAASTVSWAIRPQVLSMTALMLTCALLASARARYLPILFVIWANVHGAVLLGLVAVGAALVASLFERRRVPLELTIVAIACLLATLCTPVGWRLWPEIVASLQRSKDNALIEWSMPSFAGVMWPFWAMAVALPVAALRFRRRLAGRTLLLVAIALALLPLAVRSVRNVAMFMLVATPALTSLMRVDRSASTPPRRNRRERTVLNAAVLTGACAVGALVVALAWSARAPVLGWQPLAPAAISAVASCPDPIYNTFEGGGALIWFVPTKKVFVDNRQDPYPAPLLSAAHQLETDGRYQTLFAAYGIRCAVVPAASPTDLSLGSDPTWARAYTDPSWAIFTRR